MVDWITMMIVAKSWNVSNRISENSKFHMEVRNRPAVLTLPEDTQENIAHEIHVATKKIGGQAVVRAIFSKRRDGCSEKDKNAPQCPIIYSRTSPSLPWIVFCTVPIVRVNWNNCQITVASKSRIWKEIRSDTLPKLSRHCTRCMPAPDYRPERTKTTNQNTKQNLFSHDLSKIFSCSRSSSWGHFRYYEVNQKYQWRETVKFSRPTNTFHRLRYNYSYIPQIVFRQYICKTARKIRWWATRKYFWTEYGIFWSVLSSFWSNLFKNQETA